MPINLEPGGRGDPDRFDVGFAKIDSLVHAARAGGFEHELRLLAEKFLRIFRKIVRRGVEVFQIRMRLDGHRVDAVFPELSLVKRRVLCGKADGAAKTMQRHPVLHGCRR